MQITTLHPASVVTDVVTDSHLQIDIKEGDIITIWANDGKRKVSMQCEVRVNNGALEVFSDAAEFLSFGDWEPMRKKGGRMTDDTPNGEISVRNRELSRRDAIVRDLERWYFGKPYAKVNGSDVGQWRDIVNEAAMRIARLMAKLEAQSKGDAR